MSDDTELQASGYYWPMRSQSVIHIQQENNPFQEQDSLTDIVFRVEGRRLYFNKSFLSACSDVFHCMFTADFRERKAEEIPLPGKKLEDMVVFFKMIHPRYAHETPVTDDILSPLLDLAREYQVGGIRAKCGDYIQHMIGQEKHHKGVLTINRLLLYIWACEEYNLRQHHEELMDFLRHWPMKELTKADNFSLFRPNSALDVCSARCEEYEKFLVESKTIALDLLPQLEHLTDVPSWKCTCKFKNYQVLLYECKACMLKKQVREFKNILDIFERFDLRGPTS